MTTAERLECYRAILEASRESLQVSKETEANEIAYIQKLKREIEMIERGEFGAKPGKRNHIEESLKKWKKLLKATRKTIKWDKEQVAIWELLVEIEEKKLEDAK